jgi:hypothetical protein
MLMIKALKQLLVGFKERLFMVYCKKMRSTSVWYEEIFLLHDACTRLEQIFIDPINESCYTETSEILDSDLLKVNNIFIFMSIRRFAVFLFNEIFRHECERGFIKIIHKIDFFSQIFTRYSRQTLESISDSVFTQSWLMNVKFLIHKINFFNMLNMIRKKYILGNDKEFFHPHEITFCLLNVHNKILSYHCSSSFTLHAVHIISTSFVSQPNS